MVLACAAIAAAPARAEEIRVAVAANFAETLQALATRFEATSPHRVLLSSGSTGKHYAQILHGAPFDLLFAADAERPRLLEANGRGVPASRVTYAIGRLVLWSSDPNLVDPRGDVLRSAESFRKLAIANPLLAPYGAAAEQVLRYLRLWETLETRLVRGENVTQAYQFVRTGNAELGFVARSQIVRPDARPNGSYWLVPETAHDPIEQQAILLVDAAPARAFLAFVSGGSPDVLGILHAYGYEAP